MRRAPLAASAARLCRGKLALVGPGDVFVFTGGAAHTVLSSSQELSCTTYESFVPLGERHVPPRKRKERNAKRKIGSTKKRCGPANWLEAWVGRRLDILRGRAGVLSLGPPGAA